jgi:flagellar hook-associated protein FlgK
LPFTPGSGSFDVIVRDAAGAVTSTVTVSVTAGVTSLQDVATAIDGDASLSATVTNGRLPISAAGGPTHIALGSAIAAYPNALAAAPADAAGLVHPGDGSNALEMARLRTKLSLGGGTATFADFFGTAVSRVGSQLRDTTMALERQELSVQVVQTLQQQTSGVSTDEELIALTQAQDAYAAAARFISTTQTMVATLLDMVR